ncbi:hypothetical protein PRUPE_7G231900 [Prunus persica]|uniref:Uncharacterized protein n=1 Tax=Prunus persica TaxID=3760 RepID=A0A251NII7_PRUPE|nr:hypothetical protein PRUPE_7G231900 [Prunus persica]
MVKKNPELLPKVEHPELLPKVEPTLAKDVNKKKRKKKNPQKPILIYVDADVNPIIDAQKSIVINQALQKSAIKANPEPVPILTAVKSKKRKRKKSKTTVPVDAANQVDVAAQVGAAGQEDAAKKVKVDAELEPILTAVKSKKRKKKKSKTKKRKKKKSKTRAPVDAPEPILKAVKSNKSKTKAVKSKKSKTKAVKSKKSKTTAAKKIDAAKNVEGPKYVEICVICRKKGHLIPTCPELNEKIVPNPNHNTEQKKESGKKGSARPQPPQDANN